jgi:hypothetical protein
MVIAAVVLSVLTGIGVVSLESSAAKANAKSAQQTAIQLWRSAQNLAMADQGRVSTQALVTHMATVVGELPANRRASVNLSTLPGGFFTVTVADQCAALILQESEYALAGCEGLNSDGKPIAAPNGLYQVTLTPGDGQVIVGFTPDQSGSYTEWVAVYRDGVEVATVPSSERVWVDTNVEVGETYTYTVVPVNEIGAGEGTTGTITVQLLPTVPVWSPASRGEGRVSLSWVQAAREGAPVTGYRLYRTSAVSSVGTPVSFALLAQMTTESFTDTGLTPGTTYYYQVETLSGTSISVRGVALPVAAIAAPTAPTIQQVQQSSGSISVNFSTGATAARPVESVSVVRNGQMFSTLSTGELSFIDTSVLNGSSYTYTLTSRNEAGTSPSISTDPIVSYGLPSAPTFTSATVGTSKIDVAWAAASTSGEPISGYRLYRSTSATSGFTLLVALLEQQRSYTDREVLNGTTYFYRIESYGPGGTSARSVTYPQSGITPVEPPLTPVITSMSTTSKKVTLFFRADSTAKAPVRHAYVYRNGAQFAYLSPGETSFVDNQVSNGVAYVYRVVVQNEVAEVSSAPSNEVLLYGTPDMSTGMSAIAGSGRVDLTWLSATSTQGEPIWGYRVYRSTQSDTGFLLIDAVAGATANQYTDLGAQNGVTQFYRLESYGPGGTSEQSTSFPTTGVTPLGVPAPVTISGATVGDRIVSITFATTSTTAAPVSEIRITRNNLTWRTVPAGTTSVTDDTVTNGVDYIYRFTTANSVATGTTVSTSVLTPITAPGTPTNLVANAGPGEVLTSWSGPSTSAAPISGYRLYRSLNPDTQFTLLAVLTPASTSTFRDSTVSNSVTYFYRVESFNNYGTSARSATFPSAGTTPYGSPSAPVVTAVRIGDSVVSVDFSTSSSTTAPITEIRITRNGAAWRTLAATSTGFTDEGLTNETSYTYVITAANSAATSSGTSTGALTPNVPLPAPTSATASAGTGEVRLTWAMSSGSAQVSGYRIFRSTSSTGPFSLLQVVTGTTHTDTSVSNGVTYFYQLESYNEVTTSARSTTFPSAGATPLGIPAPVNITGATVGDNTLSISFTATSTTESPVSEVRVTRNGSTWRTLPAGTTTVVDNTVSNGTGYTYVFTTANAVAAGASVSTAVLTPFTPVPTPTGVQASAGVMSVAVRWDPLVYSEEFTGYRIQRSTSSTGPFLLLSSVSNETTSFTDTAVAAATTYFYRVQAFSALGASATSSSTSGSTPYDRPAPAVITGTTIGDGTLSVTFTTSSTAAAPISEIRVVRNSAAWRILPAGSTTFTDSGVVNGTGYTYELTTVNVVASSTSVSTGSLTPITTPSVPTATSATAQVSQVSVFWSGNSTDAAPVTGYRLYRSTNASSGFTLLETITGAAASTSTDTLVNNGTTYFYRVESYGPAGTSPMSTTFPTAGVTPLGTPAPVSITSATVGNNTLSINFTTTSTSAAPIAEIRVTRNAEPWRVLAPGTTGVTDTAVVNGTGYTYLFTTVNAVTSSAPTSSGVLTPITAASTPTNLAAVAGVSQVLVSWDSPATPAAPVSGYRLYRATSATGTYTLTATVVGESTVEHIDATVSNGTTYFYRIEAYGPGGTSPRSITFPTAGVTSRGIPAAAVITSATTGNARITVNFSYTTTVAAPVEQIVVARNGEPYTILSSLSGGTGSFTDTTVINAVTYTYTLTTRNSVTSGPSVTTAQLTPYAPPAAPSFTSVTAGIGQVSTAWTQVTGTEQAPVDGYRLYRSTSATTGFTLVATTVGQSSTAHVDTTVSNGTTYYYQVETFGSGGTSPRSASSAAVRPLGVPAPAVLGTITVGNASITVNFTTTSTTAAPADQILVERNGETWRTLTSGTKSFSDTTVINGVGYTYVLRTANSVAVSTQVSTGVLTPYAPPPMPVFTSGSAGVSEVNLTWSASDSSGAPITGYRLFRAVNTTSGSEFTLLVTLVGPQMLDYRDTAVTNGSTYYYRLESYGPGGTSTRTSTYPSSGLTPQNLPAEPVVTSTDGANAQISVYFTQNTSVAPVSSFTVTRNGQAWSTLASTTRSFIDSTVTVGVAYTYSIVANNTSGSSAPTSTGSLVAYNPPPTPTSFAASLRGFIVDLTWSTLQCSPTDPTRPCAGYRIYRSLKSGSGYALVGTVTDPATGMFTDTTSTANNTYYYQIESYGPGGTSPRSATVTVVTPK